MSFSPPLGAIAIGRSGTRAIITALEADRVILRFPDGALKPVKVEAITRWEMPAQLQPGQRCRLTGTDRTYTLIETYEHFMGWHDGDRTYEAWARLKTAEGNPATWKLIQLEAIV